MTGHSRIDLRDSLSGRHSVFKFITSEGSLFPCVMSEEEEDILGGGEVPKVAA